MAAASGALLSLAFPPFDLGPVAWIALVPLFFALSQTRSVAQSGACGLAFGLVFFGLYMRFLLVMYGALPWIAASLYQALYAALFGLAAGPVMRVGSPGWRVLGGAGAWMLGAYLRCNAGSIAFSGGDLAYSQHDQLPLLQMASVLGQLGLTFSIAAVNAALSQALLGVLPFQLWRAPTDVKLWSRRSAWAAVVCYLLLFIAYFAGALVLKTHRADSGRSLQIALVQGSVHLHTPVTNEDIAACTEAYLQLNEAVPRSTDLTIWPESALQGNLQARPPLQEANRQAARANEGLLLLGSNEALQGKHRNSALLYDNQGSIIGRYHKMDLVVYGEFVPFREQLPFLENYPIRGHDVTPGDKREVFAVKGVQVAPLICFEAMFSRPTREVCRLGAEVIAILNSDAWAQNTVEVEQHSYTASMRAVESRRYVCRAAATGQSAVYSPYGELLGHIPINGKGVLSETIYARQGLSVYHRIGDLPLVIFCLIVYCLAFWPKRGDA